MGGWRAGASRALLNASMGLSACGGRSVIHGLEANRDDGGQSAVGRGAAGAGGTAGAVAAAGAVASAGAVAIGGASGGPVTALGGAPAAGRAATGGEGAAPAVAGHAGSDTRAGGLPMRDCGAVIDDMDDRTGWICHGNGRVGAWYAYNDGFGLQVPPVEPPGTPILPTLNAGVTTTGGSQAAMYSFHSYPDLQVLAGQSDAWGAGIGFDLNFDGVVRGVYDASAFGGITFWVRSDLSNSVLVRVNTDISTPAEYGGTCATEFCGTWSTPVNVSPNWQAVTLPFSGFDFWPVDVNQPPPVPPVLDPHRLTNIQFLFAEFPPDTQARDIWLDHLFFFP